MFTLPNPQNKLLTQVNTTNVFGSIWSSFNLDLTSNLGRIRVNRMLSTTTSVINADLGLAVGFKYFNSAWWTVAGSKVHSATNSQNGFVVDGTASSPTTCSADTADIELFNGNMYVTSQTGLNKYTGSVWSTNGTSLNTATPHMMTVYAERLYITDLYSKIYSLNTSDAMVTSSTNTLSFTNSLANVITCLRSSTNRIWVCTLNTLGSKGYVYEWDGVSTQVQRAYRLQAQGALACVIKDDVPWIIDSNGALCVWTSGTFKEVARFPRPLSNVLLKKATTSVVNDRFIHPNAMTLVDGKINILVNNENGDSGATISENFPSGIWEYDENIGLYHKLSVGYTPAGTTTVTDYGQNRVSRVGALSDAKISNTGASANGTILAGVDYFSDSSTVVHGTFIDDTIDTTQKYGYFVTSWISASGLKDSWQKIYARYKKFLNSSDKISIKYRVQEATPTEITFTWDNSTSVFKTSTDLSSYVGYEVEIIQGVGSGKTAHISSVSSYGSTYFVNLDDTFTGATTTTGKARIQNWIKTGEITGQVFETWDSSILNCQPSSRIQFKVCMQFTGKDELHDITIINDKHTQFV